MTRLLIAEDDSALRTLLKKGLTKKGYETVICDDGKDAWTTLQEKPPFDVIITDMMMPHMDGREFIENIRSNDGYKNIPVIIMSGVVSIKEISDLLETGASAFIPKPIKMNSLHEEIQEMLGLPSCYVTLKSKKK